MLEGRPTDGASPEALRSRGWASFLLSLDDDELAAIETRGHDVDWPRRSPPDLTALVEQAREVCALPALPTHEGPPGPPQRRETPRKRAQIDAFGRLVAPLAARATRIVDVGSGHGHLTRDLATKLVVPVVGLERDAGLIGRARELAVGASPTFVLADVLREGLSPTASDCVIGLHACGELGDSMTAAVAGARGATLALVACCPQKRRQTSRRPLVTGADLDVHLDLPRSLLGLANLAAREQGVEATRVENLAARQRRLALNRLLSEGGLPLRTGAEIDGLNRRTAQRDLGVLVTRAFTLRGRPVPSRSAIDAAASWARSEHARVRRLSVPRAILARVLEVYLLLDRAAHLEAGGLRVQVGTLFSPSVSPRNLALVAS